MSTAANDEAPLHRFSIRRNSTQLNLGLILLVVAGIMSVVVGNSSLNRIENAVARDIADLVQSEAPEGRPVGEVMDRTGQAMSDAWIWSRSLGVGVVVLAAFLTTVLIVLGMRLITVELWIRRMGAGDLDYKPTIRGRDEVTETARSVEELRQRSIKALQLDLVRKLSEGLKEKNEELEGLVEQLQRSQEQIIMRRKLVELGELTAGVAHEIRNPLNFMKNFSEASEDLVSELEELIAESAGHFRGTGHEEIREITGHLSVNLRRIRKHGGRVERIVGDMVKMGQGGGEPQLVSVNDLLAKQAYIPTVWLTTRRVGVDIEIRIRDNGCGIPDDVIDKIFNPFFTTKPTDKGTGLGLSLSHDIVRQHGGSITPVSKAGEYTEMIITFPAGAEMAAVA